MTVPDHHAAGTLGITDRDPTAVGPPTREPSAVFVPAQGGSALEIASITPAEEELYWLLISSGQSSIDRVAAHLSLSPAAVQGLVDRLVKAGLATLSTAPDGLISPIAPEESLSPLLQKRQEAVDRARAAVARMTEVHRATVRRADAHSLVEIVTGRSAIRQQIRALQESAQEEVLWLCRAGHVAMPSEENLEEYAALRRGVAYRVVYERELLTEPGMLASVSKGVRAGEQARAITRVPVRLAIADQRTALCPLVSSADGVSEPTVAVIRSSMLLTALVALFEGIWAVASPLHPDDAVRGTPSDVVDAIDGRAVSDDERHLLSLLVAGLPDKAIATSLGVSLRTVRRRIGGLLVRADCDTRAQLVWQSARRGWL